MEAKTQRALDTMQKEVVRKMQDFMNHQLTVQAMKENEELKAKLQCLKSLSMKFQLLRTTKTVVVSVFDTTEVYLVDF